VVLAVRKMANEDYNYVVVDNHKGEKDMAEYMLSLIYPQIAIITEPSYISTGLDRLKGYKDMKRR
jgi:DNA-binding LacI/PurR family transcriptional regulator